MQALRELTHSFGHKSDKKKDAPPDKDKDKAAKSRGVKLGEVADDAADKFKHWRVLNPKALQDIEQLQMAKIHAIYKREIGDIPDALELVEKSKSFMMMTYKYTESKRQITDLDFDVKKWLGLMKDNDGPFKYQATEIVKICCKYQTIKAKRHTSKGFYTDPENLFCEDVKVWATNSFSLMDITPQNKDLLWKRIRYFEEILCEDNLFDRPNSRVTHTVQQVIVGVRGTLKYHTIPVVDNDLAHHDARKAFDSIKKHIVILVSDAVEFLYHVFRLDQKKGEPMDDQCFRLLTLILDDDAIKKAFPDSQREVRAKVMGNPDYVESEKKSRKNFLTLGPNNTIFIAEDLLVIPKGHDDFPPASNNKNPATDQQLSTMFVGERSGMEPRFRGNHFIARSFLKAHAVVLELGYLFTVIDKAAACASAGGTLLVYGIANAQLNAMLDTTDDLLSAMRDTFNLLSQISEVRFEELVYKNEATASRNPWISHFKLVHSTLASIFKMIQTIAQELALMKSQANSMTLYEQFQKAQQDTDSFLSSAVGFSKHMSEVLGIPYEKPKPPPVMKLPSGSQLESLVSESDSLGHKDDEAPAMLDFTANMATIENMYQKQR